MFFACLTDHCSYSFNFCKIKPWNHSCKNTNWVRFWTGEGKTTYFGDLIEVYLFTWTRDNSGHTQRTLAERFEGRKSDEEFSTPSGTDQMGTGFMILYCGISYLKKLIRTLILNSFCESSPFMWLLTVQRWTEQEKKKKKKSLAQQIYSSCLVIPCIFLHKWWGQYHPALCSMKLTERAVPAHNWFYWAGGLLPYY